MRAPAKFLGTSERTATTSAIRYEYSPGLVLAPQHQPGFHLILERVGRSLGDPPSAE